MSHDPRLSLSPNISAYPVSKKFHGKILLLTVPNIASSPKPGVGTRNAGWPVEVRKSPYNLLLTQILVYRLSSNLIFKHLFYLLALKAENYLQCYLKELNCRLKSPCTRRSRHLSQLVSGHVLQSSAITK
jgi:hypothetical protein